MCHKPYIKQYISMHIKKKHTNSLYSKMISRGMRSNLYEPKKFIVDSSQIFCDICCRFIAKKSLYIHFKTKLHNSLNSIKGSKNGTNLYFNSSLKKDTQIILKESNGTSEIIVPNFPQKKEEKPPEEEEIKQNLIFPMMICLIHQRL